MPPIVLDYRLSPEWNRHTYDVDLRAANETTLRYDCFLGDIVFTVGEADFSTQWGWVPVLDFALSLRAIAGALVTEAQQTFEFTESEAALEFVREGNRVTIRATYAPAVAEVAHVDLSLEAERFLGRLVQELVRTHPALADNAFVSSVPQQITVPP